MTTADGQAHPWTLDGIDAAFAARYAAARVRWSRQRALVDATLALLDRSGWLHVEPSPEACRESTSMRRQRALLIGVPLDDPEEIHATMVDRSPTTGGVLGLRFALAVVRRCYATACFFAMHDLYFESLAVHRRMVEAILDVCLVLADPPKRGWIYFRDQRDRRQREEDRRKGTKRKRNRWQRIHERALEKMRNKPREQRSDWQAMLLDRLPDVLHGGVHAGVQHALMTTVAPDPADDHSGHAVASFFDDLAAMRVGHLATSATAALLDLIAPLVPQHPSMHADTWSSGLRQLEPRLAELAREAQRGRVDLPRDIAAALARGRG